MSRNSFGTRRYPVLECLRCGADLDCADTGRPRKYCSDACRRAGNRLYLKHGPQWYEQQPWYEPWCAEEDRRAAEWEAGRAEREQREAADRQAAEERWKNHRELLKSMPPDVRAAYDRERRRDKARANVAMMRMELDGLTGKYEDDLRTLGMSVQLIRGSVKVEKLLWSAVLAENESEAMALFAKARKLGADAADMPGHGPGFYRDLLKDLFGSDLA